MPYRQARRKGTTLLNDADHSPADRTAATDGSTSRRRQLAAGPAADAIGSVLDLHMTGSHVVHAMAPRFCDAVSVYLLERWLRDDTARVLADPPQVEARRLALRIGDEGPEAQSAVLPIDEVQVFPRHTPYARAMATGRAQLLQAFDQHTADRLTASGHNDARISDLLRTTASFLVVPMLLHGTTIGFIAATRGPQQPFGPADTIAAESLASRAAGALDNARRFEHARRTALAIRRSLLPVTDQTFDGCRVASAYQPAGRDNLIGGDWFDVIPRPGRRVGLIVGDAMGHGPEAAVAMIQLRASARTLARMDMAPHELLRELDALAKDTPEAPFATCIYAEWDAGRSTCTFVGAGHPPPLLSSDGAPARPVELRGGLPLGLNAEHFEPVTVPVHGSAHLLLYSDGLVESRHFDIDVGIERLAAAVDTGMTDRAAGHGLAADLQSLCDALLEGADAVTDDRTVLLAELTPGTA